MNTPPPGSRGRVIKRLPGHTAWSCERSGTYDPFSTACLSPAFRLVLAAGVAFVTPGIQSEVTAVNITELLSRGKRVPTITNSTIILLAK